MKSQRRGPIVLSYNGYDLSEQTVRTILKQVLIADGPIVFPMNENGIKTAKYLCEKELPHIHQSGMTTEAFASLGMSWLAAVAMSWGKKVVALRNSKEQEKETFLQEALLMTQQADNHERAKAIFKTGANLSEASMARSAFLRLKPLQPALILAEDNQAQLLSKAFRGKLVRVTKDSPNVRKLVRQSSRALRVLLEAESHQLSIPSNIYSRKARRNWRNTVSNATTAKKRALHRLN